MNIDARMEPAAAKPAIVPNTIVVDGGKVFVSEAFTRACEWLDIPAAVSARSTVSDSRLTIPITPCPHTLYRFM
ncbi:hypothetical protein [Streptosporangium vulgare]|uniref:hypothetical protein n=1 Tax=Streptosporangium vulgare TaxID=46190 RepID=UPI0031CEFCF1